MLRISVFDQKSFNHSNGSTTFHQKHFTERHLVQNTKRRRLRQNGHSRIDQTFVGKTSVGRTSVGKTSVGKMSVGKVSVGKMSVGKMSVGKVFLGQKSRRHSNVGHAGTRLVLTLDFPFGRGT